MTEQSTRLLFLGEENVADGFRLIGFEVYPNPSAEDTERLLRDLRRAQTRAFVVVDDALMSQKIPSLQRILAEGGRIIVIAVPALGAVPHLTSSVAQRLGRLFGNAPQATGASDQRGSP
ncbi:ATPase [Caldichromatium japonicum]|uniref:ATPase n=1 Tax=Caldichromatium japonicum TaxID=2699430 RepID=A0A6G7VDW2_9GAMM|nr:V-type ATP synthase subunit F [Caldichromatium japonicum]QIK38038.1 ATPase [Caldichromatium japonicum]